MAGIVYFFVQPRESFVVEGRATSWRSRLFFFCGVGCAALGHAQREGEPAAEADARSGARRAHWRTRSAGARGRRGRARHASAPSPTRPADRLGDPPDGYHEYYNRRWYDYTGVPGGSSDGEGWNALFHPDDRHRAGSGGVATRSPPGSPTRSSTASAGRTGRTAGSSARPCPGTTRAAASSAGSAPAPTSTTAAARRRRSRPPGRPADDALSQVNDALSAATASSSSSPTSPRTTSRSRCGRSRRSATGSGRACGEGLGEQGRDYLEPDAGRRRRG